jgi:hypothetical protein
MNRNTSARALGIAHSIIGPMGTMRYTDQGALDAGALDEAGATRWVYPADVLAAKERIDAKVTSLAADVAACAGLAAADVAAWNAFRTAWRQFYCRGSDGACTEPDASWFGIGGQMDDCETYEASLYAWQEKFAPLCRLSAPVGSPPVPTDARGSDLTTPVRWGVIGLGILAGLYVLHETGVLRLVATPRRRGCATCGTA